MILPDLAAIVRDAAPEELPALCGRLREAEMLAEQRIRESKPAADTSVDRGLLTYQQAAEFLCCSASYVEVLVRQRKIPHVRLPATDKGGRSRDGRLVRLRAEDLRAWADQHRA